MRITVRRPIVWLMALLLLSGLMALLTAGCGSKEEAPPKGGDYYTGPMKSKTETGAAPGKTGATKGPGSDL